MKSKEGLIPTALGVAVTATGLISREHIPNELACGIIGFGLAHIVLGSIDLFQHKDDENNNGTLYTFSD